MRALSRNHDGRNRSDGPGQRRFFSDHGLEVRSLRRSDGRDPHPVAIWKSTAPSCSVCRCTITRNQTACADLHWHHGSEDRRGMMHVWDRNEFPVSYEIGSLPR